MKAIVLKSRVWRHFHRSVRLGVPIAECKHCSAILEHRGRIVKLVRHMNRVHKALLDKIIIVKRTIKFRPSSEDNDTAVRAMPLTPNPSESPSVDLGSFKETSTAVVEPLSLRNPFSSAPRCEQLQVEETSNEEDKNIKDALVSMICTDKVSFDIVEYKGFKTLLQTTAPRCKVPSKESLKNWLDEKYSNLAKRFSEYLRSVKHISLSIAKFPEGAVIKSLYAVSAHFGSNVAVTLDVFCSTKSRMETDFIDVILKETYSNWGIDESKLSAFVVDKALCGNETAVSLSDKFLPCYVAELNYVVVSSMKSHKEMRTLINAVTIIAKWFEKSDTASSELQQLAGKKMKLFSELPCSFLKTFHMLKRFDELFDSIYDIISRRSPELRDLMYTTKELDVLKLALHVLKPIERAMDEFLSNHYCACSKVIPIIHCMILKIQNLGLSFDFSRSLRSSILDGIDYNREFSKIEKCQPLAVAMILDPRFKLIHFTDPNAEALAVSHLMKLIYTDQNLEPYTSQAQPEDSSSLWNDHHKLVQERNEIKLHDIVEREVRLYLMSPVADIKRNPLQIWEDELKAAFPNMYKITNKYLTMVATAVPPNRLVSKVMQVTKDQKSESQITRLNKFLFMQTIPKDLLFN